MAVHYSPPRVSATLHLGDDKVRRGLVAGTVLHEAAVASGIVSIRHAGRPGESGSVQAISFHDFRRQVNDYSTPGWAPGFLPSRTTPYAHERLLMTEIMPYPGTRRRPR